MGHGVWWWLAVVLALALACGSRWIKGLDPIERRPHHVWFRGRTPVCWQGWLLVIGFMVLLLGGIPVLVMFCDSDIPAVARAGGVMLLFSVTCMATSEGELPAPGHCPHCGYDLTGNTSGVCPECGEKA